MTRRKRGPIRILVGLLMIVGGLAGVTIGIVAVIGERDRIDDEAVTRGELPAELSFTAEAREYRVFVVSGNAESDSARTACQTSTGADFDGSNQGVSVTLGNASSVGTFDGSGQMTIACDGPEGVSFLVTPTGDGLLRSILFIVGGVLVGLVGLGLVIWGLVGRKVPV
jgi:hypothetical protein